jgi:uncharacterized protein (TIGR03437 family)
MLNRVLPLIFMVAAAAGSLEASVFCTLSAVPVQVNAEGLAEPMGDILVNCSGANAGSTITGTFQINVGGKIANVIDPEQSLTGGITLSRLDSGSYVPVPYSSLSRLDNSIYFQGSQVLVSGDGTFTVKISGIRANGSTSLAYVQHVGSTESLSVTSPVVSIAHASVGLYGSVSGAVVAGFGPSVPSTLDFANLIALGAPEAGVRVTEGYAMAFEPRGGSVSATNGTRIRIKLTGIPSGVRLFAPDAVAGSDATQPTWTSAFSNSTGPGMYGASEGHSLLLVRLNSPAIDGSGGGLAMTAPSSLSILSGVGEVTVSNSTAYIVYEVADANPAALESAQIPIWICLPIGYQVAASQIGTTINLAPLSAAEGAVIDAPIPRYREAAVSSDCALQGDCESSRWPSLTASPSQTSFTLSANGASATAYVSLQNAGGGILQWQASVRYRSTTGWIKTYTNMGTGASTYRFDVSSANLVFQQINSPNGVNVSKTIPVSLDVTAAPLVDPAPVITDIVSLDTGWNMAVAPGGIVLVQGSNLSTSTAFTVGGKTALVTASGDSNVTLEVPSDVPLGVQNVVAMNGTSTGKVFYLTIQSVAPAIIMMLNSDGTRNADGVPATTGQELQLYVTGIRQAAGKLVLHLHDRELTPSVEATSQVGVDLLRVTVPVDLPTMQTALHLCATSADGETVCSYPKNIWLNYGGE